jgi:hypothetical protein
MKKLLMLSLIAASILAMEVDLGMEAKIQKDHLLPVSLLEAYMKGKFSIKNDQICFGKYNYSPTYRYPTDPAPYSLKLNAACTVIAGMSNEMKNKYESAVQYYGEASKEMLEKSPEGWLMMLQSIRLGKFCLNLDLPVEIEKEKHTIIAKRQRWHNAFTTEDPKTAIAACLKDLSFASKLPSLQEEEKIEKEKLRNRTKMEEPVDVEDEYKAAEQLEDERVAKQQKKKGEEVGGWSCIVS